VTQPIVLIARHGETQGNIQDVFRSMLDFPIDDSGMRQAKEAAEFCAHFPVTLVIASPLQRATATGQAIAERCGVPLEQDSRLLPWNVGFLMGQPKTPELKKVSHHYIAHPDETIPNGESIADEEDRFREILEEAITQGRMGKLLVLATHGSGVMATNSILSGEKDKSDDSEVIQPGGVAGIFVDGNAFRLKPLLRAQTEAIQGTKRSGYIENGKQYCGDCIHRKPGTPLCLHPEVNADPEMQDRKLGDVTRIDLENGCCDYVNKGNDAQPQDS